MTSIPPWKTHEPDATNVRNTRGQSMIDSRRYGYMNVVGGSELKLEQSTMELVCNDKAGDGSPSSCGLSGTTACTTRRASIAATNSLDNQGVDETNSSHRRRVRGSLLSTPQRSNEIRIRASTGSFAAARQEGSTAGSFASCPAGGISRAKRDATRASRDLLEPLRTKGRQHFGLKRNRPSENSNSGDEQGTEPRRVGSPHRLIRRSLIADDTGYSSPNVYKSTRISPPIQANINVSGRPSQDAVRQDGISILERAYSQESLGDSTGNHAWRREDEGKGVAKSFVSSGNDELASTLGVPKKASENPPGNWMHPSDSVGNESPPILQPLQHSLKMQRLCSSPISSSSPIDTLTVGVQSLGVLSPGAPLGAKDRTAVSRTTTDLIWPRQELEGVTAAKTKANQPARKLNGGAEPLVEGRKEQRGERPLAGAHLGEDSTLRRASSSTHVLRSAMGPETAFDSPASTSLLRESNSSTKEDLHEQSTSRTSPPSPLSPLCPPSPSSPPSPPSPQSRSPRSRGKGPRVEDDPAGNQGRIYRTEVCTWKGQEGSVAMDVDVAQGNRRSSGGDFSNTDDSLCFDAGKLSTKARGPALTTDAEAASTFGDDDGEGQGAGQNDRDCGDGDDDQDGGGAGAGTGASAGSCSGSDDDADADGNAGDADNVNDADDGADHGDGDSDGGGGAGGDADDDSSDAGAAHEEISVWLHSTQDWWTS